MNKGLKQGDGLAPLLFNLALEYVIRKSNINTEGTLVYKSVQIAAYADDINIMARTERELKDTYKCLVQSAREVGLEVNATKTKALIQTRSQKAQEGSVVISEQKIEIVQNFHYLGTMINNNHNELQEIQNRILKANRTYYALLSMFKSKNVHPYTKIRLYKTMIRPVLIYGCETWAMTKNSENLINAFERKILRRIFGPINDQGIWRIRYNRELYQQYKEAELSTVVKFKRLQWAGHVQRMEESSIPRKAMKGKMFGKRHVGKPQKRWIDAVKEDSQQILRCRNWEKIAMDRDEWRTRIVKAKARFGL